jgi:prepilin-type N-terminal cleavage/methylation domain-containing protein/prepilin-type processing-associated H-X9-DG protein
MKKNCTIARSKLSKNIKFTLIELLIVISIIAILASMLLPALRNARNASKTIRCTSNLKQISLSFFQYTGDWNYYLPTPNSPRLSDGDVRSNLSFNGGDLTIIKQDYFNMSSTRLGTKYTGILDCPMMARPVCKNNDGSDNSTRTNYSMTYHQSHYNTSGLYEDVIIPEKFTTSGYPRPSSTLWVGDTGRRGYPVVAGINSILERLGSIHNKGLNMLYMDGHVKQKALLQVKTWEINPKAPIN